eukprot:RCo007807
MDESSRMNESVSDPPASYNNSYNYSMVEEEVPDLGQSARPISRSRSPSPPRPRSRSPSPRQRSPSPDRSSRSQSVTLQQQRAHSSPRSPASPHSRSPSADSVDRRRRSQDSLPRHSRSRSPARSGTGPSLPAANDTADAEVEYPPDPDFAASVAGKSTSEATPLPSLRQEAVVEGEEPPKRDDSPATPSAAPPEGANSEPPSQADASDKYSSDEDHEMVEQHEAFVEPLPQAAPESHPAASKNTVSLDPATVVGQSSAPTSAAPESHPGASKDTVP